MFIFNDMIFYIVLFLYFIRYIFLFIVMKKNNFFGENLILLMILKEIMYLV